jgi:hypothetical protein
MKFDSDVILTTEEYKEYLELKNKYVWHDAKEPKNVGYYPVLWKGRVFWMQLYWDGRIWLDEDNIEYDPDYYFPLPPERSGE